MVNMVTMEAKDLQNRNRTTIELKTGTREFLASIGRKNETYDALVLRLAQAALLCERDHRTETNRGAK
jgi:hypothetical protein